MQLSQLEDPLSTWQYAERFLGGGTRAYSRFAGDLEVSTPYHPQLGGPAFDIETFLVPDALGGFRGNGVSSPLTKVYGGPDGFLLPVHPDTLTDPALPDRAALAGCEPGPRLRAVPTANVRTVFVTAIGGREVEPHFVKLHFPRRLSRFTRRLRRPIIETQLWVAERWDSAGVPFLREVAGGWLGRDPREAWGFLVRECPIAPGEYVVPLFALYGSDRHHPDDPPLIAQLVAASGQDATGYLAERVVEPLVRLWCRIVRDTGCVAEPHGQNTLFAFGPIGPGGSAGPGGERRTRVIYRDCGVYVDPARRPVGEDLPPINVISRDVAFPAARVLSLAYDSFLGHHSLDLLARVAQDRLGVPSARLRAAARRAFAEELDGAVELPATVFYYDDELHPDGGWALTDTGRPPCWR